MWPVVDPRCVRVCVCREGKEEDVVIVQNVVEDYFLSEFLADGVDTWQRARSSRWWRDDSMKIL